MDAQAQIIAKATEWIRRQQRADIDWSQLSDGFPMTAESARAGADLLGPLGEPLRVEHVGRKTNALGITTHGFRITFAGGAVGYELGLFPDGKINQLSVKPIPGEAGPLDHLIPTAR